MREVERLEEERHFVERARFPLRANFRHALHKPVAFSPRQQTPVPDHSMPGAVGRRIELPEGCGYLDVQDRSNVAVLVNAVS